MNKQQSAQDIHLIPIGSFKKTLKKVFSNTKQESDRQLAELQVSNLRKRQAKKHH